MFGLGRGKSAVRTVYFTHKWPERLEIIPIDKRGGKKVE